MNMQKLMAEAQKMQRDITKKQQDLESTVFEGNSEWVELTINGKYELKTFKIKYEGNITSDDKKC
jgi:DNA-binding protein YbaB